MKRLILIIGAFGLLLNLAVGKEIGEIPLLIKEDVELDAKTYHITNNILIRAGATLSCKPGAKLVMHNHAVITVEGSLELKGQEKNLIQVYGAKESHQGQGFIVTGKNKGHVELQYVYFHHLEKVLNLQVGWFRNNVTIENCQFSEIRSYGPCITVSNTDNLEFQIPAYFKFNNNSFVDNKASIFISDVNEANLRIEFSNNLISGNKGYGSNLEGAITSPVYFVTNDDHSQSIPVVKNNAFFNNYLIDSDHDTIVRELNFGLGGSRDMNFPSNYFGSGSTNRVLEKIDHYFINDQAPVLDIDPLLTSIPPDVPTYINAISVNGSVIPNIEEFNSVNTEYVDLEISFSQPIDTSLSQAYLSYTAYNSVDESVNEKDLNAKKTWQGNRKIRLRFLNPITASIKQAFYAFSGFVDSRGFKVPRYALGENSFHRFVAKNAKQELNNQAGEVSGDATLTKDDLALLLEELRKNREEFQETKNRLEAEKMNFYLTETFELGGFMGTSFYFGDLTGNDFVEPTDLDFSVGLRCAYNWKPRLTPRFNIYYGNVHGSDISQGGAHSSRGFQFRSTIAEFSGMMEININKFGKNEAAKWTPTFAIGLGMFYYNPKWTYNENGVEYEFALRELGTNGQYARGGKLSRDDIGGYGPWALCMPIELGFKRIMGRKNQWVSAFSIGWRYTWTDNIDDVGGYTFATRAEMTSNAQIEQYNIVAKRMGISPTIVQNAALSFWAPNDGGMSGNRGNASITDWYFYAGVSISRVIPYKKQAQPKGSEEI